MEARHRDGTDLKEHILASQTFETSFEFLNENSSQSVKLKNNYFKLLFMTAFAQASASLIENNFWEITVFI